MRTREMSNGVPMTDASAPDAMDDAMDL